MTNLGSPCQVLVDRMRGVVQREEYLDEIEAADVADWLCLSFLESIKNSWTFLTHNSDRCASPNAALFAGRGAESLSRGCSEFHAAPYLSEFLGQWAGRGCSVSASKEPDRFCPGEWGCALVGQSSSFRFASVFFSRKERRTPNITKPCF